MKTFKKTDTWLSIGLIVAGIATGLWYMDSRFIYFYFIVGGWQLCSILVHQWNRWFTEKGTWRLFYHRLVIATIAFTCIGWLFKDILIFILIALLFLTPVMAVCYTIICYREVYSKMQRPLAQLK